MAELIMRKSTYPTIMKERYLISENGDVYDIVREKFLKPYLHHTGYQYISMSGDAELKPNKTLSVQIHRLVAHAYVPNPENKPVVDHIDGDKLNNHFSNLEWVTIAENTRRASNTGLLHGECYGESIAHEICKLFEEGKSMIEVYRILSNDEYASVKENKSLYSLVNRLANREIWDNITSQYNYSTDQIKKPGRKSFKVSTDSKYSEKLIREICSFLEQGWGISRIYYHYFPNDKNVQEHIREYNLIQSLRSREYWDYITKDYRYSLESTSERYDINAIRRDKEIRESDAYKYFVQGMTKKEVRRMLGITSKRKDNPKVYALVEKAYDKYKSMMNISNKENIYTQK